jgi:branched-chain amino acid aminotransferase
MRYINYNGNIYNEHETLLQPGNRGFKYGDGFFETIVMFNRKMPLLDFHWSRLEFTAEVLSATLPKHMDMERLESMIMDLVSVNDAVQNARLRVHFFRKGGGLYCPDEEELGYVISMDALENTSFECGNGIVAGIKEDCYKSVSMISDLKTTSCLNYVLAAQFARAEGWDDIILLNQYGQICESLYCNVVIVKQGKLVTPDLDSGCINGVMRTYLLATLDEGLEERPIEMHELLDADEILLTNAVRGVQWVKVLGSRTYTNKKAVELTALLNKNLLNKI